MPEQKDPKDVGFIPKPPEAPEQVQSEEETGFVMIESPEEQHEAENEAHREQEHDEQRDGDERLAQLRKDTTADEARPMVTVSQSDIAQFVEKNVPKHLRQPSVIAIIANNVLRTIERVQSIFSRREFVGREHFPKDGPYIIVANHSRANDPHTITLLSGRPLRIATADIHFGNPISAWLHKAVGLFEVRSTLTNLNAEEKTALMERVPKHEQAYYQKAAERAPDMADVRKFARETAALLARGDAVTIFPEGLWLFEGNKLRKAYSGLELVAREYKRITNKNIPIVPVAISGRRVVVDEPLILGPGDSIHTIMQKIAKQLPEEERGFYA